VIFDYHWDLGPLGAQNLKKNCLKFPLGDLVVKNSHGCKIKIIGTSSKVIKIVCRNIISKRTLYIASEKTKQKDLRTRYKRDIFKPFLPASVLYDN